MVIEESISAENTKTKNIQVTCENRETKSVPCRRDGEQTDRQTKSNEKSSYGESR